MLWSRSLEGEPTNLPNFLMSTSDGGFLVAGFVFKPGLTVNNDGEIIKFDRNADIEWVGIYGAASTDALTGVV